MDRQCSSCGGFCKKSGCERDNVPETNFGEIVPADCDKGRKMTPTNKLRFVERESYVKNGEAFSHPYTYKVLQQWWAPHRTYSDGYGYTTMEIKGGEWRDIPLEKAND